MISTAWPASIALLPKERALPLIYSTVISFRFEPLNAWLEIKVQLAVITMQLSPMLEEPRHVAPGSALISSHASVHTTRHAKPMARTDDLASCSTAARLDLSWRRIMEMVRCGRRAQKCNDKAISLQVPATHIKRY